MAKNVLKPIDPLQILDVGGGYGIFLFELKKELRAFGIKVNAVSTNVRLIQKSNGFSKGIKQSVCAAEKLNPEWTNRFHLVVSTFAFPYVKDKVKGLNEIIRVLHPNGIASVSHVDHNFHKETTGNLLTGISVKDFRKSGIGCNWVLDDISLKYLLLKLNKSSQPLPFKLRRFETRRENMISHYKRIRK